MIDSVEGGPFLLEADQGDSISGYMGRDEVADLIVATLSMPEVRTGWGGGSFQGVGKSKRGGTTYSSVRDEGGANKDDRRSYLD